MMSDEYIKISCPNCESEYALEFTETDIQGTPDYCPFCGDEIPDDEEENSYEEEDDSDDYRW